MARVEVEGVVAQKYFEDWCSDMSVLEHTA
jgi:hypothetical protein